VCCHLFRNVSKHSVLELVNRFCAVDFCVFDRDIQLSGKTKRFVIKHVRNEVYIKAIGGKGNGNNREVSLFSPNILSCFKKDTVLGIRRMF
jgi:hypothetical protein